MSLPFSSSLSSVVAFGIAAAVSATSAAACTPTEPRVPAITVPVESNVKSQPIIATSPNSAPREEEGAAITDHDSLPEDSEAVGLPAPGISAKAVLSQSAGLAGLVQLHRDKITVIHFWATWCGPCKMSLPQLDALQRRYQRRGSGGGRSGVEVIGVSVDDETAGLAAFAKENGVTFPIVWDDGHDIASRYRVNTMPSTFIVDGDGIVRFVHNGYHMGEETTIESEVDGLAKH